MIARAERIARQVVPDLVNTPLYVVQPGDGLLKRAAMQARGGFFLRGLDEIMRPELLAAGEWQGPGVAIAIDVDAITSAAKNADDALRAITGLLLHELAHAFDQPERQDDPAPTRAEFTEIMAQPIETTPAPAIPIAFWHHGRDFIRLCCHLWFRSCHGGGLCLRPVHLAFASDYDGLEMLSTPGEYISALYCELEAMQDQPLRTLAATEPPRDFQEIWRSDERRVYQEATT